MIVAFWCILVAAILPLGCAYVAKFGAKSGDAGDGARYDNREPRVWLARQTGVRGRANAAQANSFEAFPFFAAGVLVAVVQHAPVATIDVLAASFVAARIVYIACYLAELAALRSVVWLAGFAACVGLFVVAASGTLR